MLERGYISQLEYDQVEATPIEGYTLPRVENSSTQISELARLAGTDYLIEEIRNQIEDRYGDRCCSAAVSGSPPRSICAFNSRRTRLR